MSKIISNKGLLVTALFHDLVSFDLSLKPLRLSTRKGPSPVMWPDCLSKNSYHCGILQHLAQPPRYTEAFLFAKEIPSDQMCQYVPIFFGHCLSTTKSGCAIVGTASILPCQVASGKESSMDFGRICASK